MKQFQKEQVEWPAGRPFRLESDGTPAGTKFIDGKTGEVVGYLVALDVVIDVNKMHPLVVLHKRRPV